MDTTRSSRAEIGSIRAGRTGAVTTRSGAVRHYAGLALHVRPDRRDAVCAALAELPGVEVRLRHPDGERLIAVVESIDVEGQVAALRRVREVPGVLVAAPAFHLVDDPDHVAAGPGAPRTPRGGK
jgi:nitrate reductase NapAB chaperone NapD